MKLKLLPYLIISLSLILVSCNGEEALLEDKTQDFDERAWQSEHSSRNALDWSGVYVGSLPCANCSSISMELHLNYDETYIKRTLYLGKGSLIFEETGSFSWDENGNSVTLSNSESLESEIEKFQVGENQLFYLDKEGNRIEGDLADSYILKKVEKTTGLRNKYWQLKETNLLKIISFPDDLPNIPVMNIGEDNISGSFGCNRYFGSFEIQEDSLLIKNLATTLMLCQDDSLEQVLVKHLNRNHLIELQNLDTLNLYSDHGKMQFVATYLDLGRND